MTGAHRRLLAPHAGLCLEPQHFPDSPNQPGFAVPVLRPGQQYHSSTIWQFALT
jgi:aldose 1-epimerase